MSNVICTARRKADHNNKYKIKNTTLFAKLRVTEEELRIFGGYTARRRKKNDARDARRHEKKTARNAAILEGFWNSGTYQGAAKAAGCDPRTARKVIMAYYKKTAVDAQAENQTLEEAVTARGTHAKSNQQIVAIYISKEIQHRFLTGNPGSNLVTLFCRPTQKRFQIPTRKNGRYRMFIIMESSGLHVTQTLGHMRDRPMQLQAYNAYVAPKVFQGSGRWSCRVDRIRHGT